MYCYCKRCRRCFEEADAVIKQPLKVHMDGSSPYNTPIREITTQHCPHCGSSDFVDCFVEYTVVQPSGDEIEIYEELIDAERAAEAYEYDEGLHYHVFEKITDRHTGEVLYNEEF